METVIELGLYAAVFVASLAYFLRYRRRQRTDDGRDDLRSLALRTDRPPDHVRHTVRWYGERADRVALTDDSGEPVVLASTAGPLQPGYFFRIRIRAVNGGSRLDVGVRSRMPFYLWHPFVDREVDRLVEELLRELEPASRVS